MNDNFCTACGDVVKIIDFEGDKHRNFSLYKTLIIDAERNDYGWCYFLLIEDDKFPIVITEQLANDALNNLDSIHNLIFNRWFDRHK